MSEEYPDRTEPTEEATDFTEAGNAAPTDERPVLSTDRQRQAQHDFNESMPARESMQEVSVDTDGSELREPSLPYPLVAVGASAGGLQAFGEMLDNLSAETGMAFVLVSHLSPSHDTQIVSLLQQHTSMPVLPIVHGERPLANHVHVLMPNVLVELQGGAFQVKPRSANDRSPATINLFFRSVAEDQRNLSVGVILSGGDGDGAEGLKTIKGEGGLALVQTPETAVQSSMPRSSIAADHVDVVLPPKRLAVELERIAQDFARPELQILEQGKAPQGEDPAFQRILQLLRNQSGLELRQYKPETIRRRMARRMILLRMENLTDYHRFLQARPDEIRALQEDILINVTRFFRDADFWQALRTQALPSLLQDRAPGKPVRIWCAGCSTGEEAYSLAITVLEYITNNGLDIPVQVFGTDASDRSIEKARTAVYPDTIANDIAPERLRRYFTKVDNGFQVAKRVRDLCIFARQNLCNDPPFSHMDIVSCRNVMIYFNQALQRQIMSTFHYALDPGGQMLLGMSEGLRDYGEAFEPVDRKHKIYSKLGGSTPTFPSAREYRFSRVNPVGRSTSVDDGELWPESDLQRAADRIVLARFGPPALVVDERMHVLQSRGQTTPLIQLTPGAVSWNLVRVLRSDIVNDVRSAVQQAIDENIPVTSAINTFLDGKGRQTLQVDVLPIVSPGARLRCFLILFQQMQEEDSVPAAPDAVVARVTSEDEKDAVMRQLRNDLTATRFHLQTIVEERDARNQELVSANEEIQSANEELQSTNEELETTKEELQSTNEELQTVNDELQQRNTRLEQTGNDLKNLLNSVSIPLMMLTSDLHIRQFTPPMQKLISVLPSDIGRSISDIRMHLSIDNLEPLLEGVLDTLSTHESEVQDRDGRWYLLRIRPYRTSDNKIEGIVVVLVDIDQLRSSQQKLMEARDFSQSVVESVPVPFVVLDKDCSIRSVNTAFRELAQMRAAELSGRSLPDLVHHLWGLDDINEPLSRLMAGDPGGSFTLEHVSTTSEHKTLLVRAQALLADGDRVILFVMEDITLRRQAEQVLSQQRENLQQEVTLAAQELDRTQQELRGLTGHLFSVQEEERQRVARELHDDVGQRLSALTLLINSFEDAPPAFAGKLGEARDRLQALSNDVRKMSHHLHPAVLDDLGLSAGLKALVNEFGEREGMPATYVARGLPQLPAQPAVTAVYRITQEALRNVAKHAGKTHVKVILEARDGKLHLEIRDLGGGFDTDVSDSNEGLGMITMKERARLAHGTLEVTSALGEGTNVVADIPFDEHA